MHLFMDEPLDQQPASLERCYELFQEELEKREKEWEMKAEEPKSQENSTPEFPKFAAAGLAGIALPATSGVMGSDGEDVEISQENGSLPGEATDESEPEESEEKMPTPEELKANAKAMMAQAAGLDFDALPPEVKKQAEEQMDKIIGKVTENDPEKIMEMERQEIEAQLDKSLAEAGIDRNNLPQLSPKAQAEQTRFMEELGMDTSMIDDSEELKQFWGIFGALLPKMGLDPENLDLLLVEAKKQMEKISNQAGDEINDA